MQLVSANNPSSGQYNNSVISGNNVGSTADKYSLKCGKVSY